MFTGQPSRRPYSEGIHSVVLVSPTVARYLHPAVIRDIIAVTFDTRREPSIVSSQPSAHLTRREGVANSFTLTRFDSMTFFLRTRACSPQYANTDTEVTTSRTEVCCYCSNAFVTTRPNNCINLNACLIRNGYNRPAASQYSGAHQLHFKTAWRTHMFGTRTRMIALISVIAILRDCFVIGCGDPKKQEGPDTSNATRKQDR